MLLNVGRRHPLCLCVGVELGERLKPLLIAQLFVLACEEPLGLPRLPEGVLNLGEGDRLTHVLRGVVALDRLMDRASIYDGVVLADGNLEDVDVAVLHRTGEIVIDLAVAQHEHLLPSREEGEVVTRRCLHHCLHWRFAVPEERSDR